MLDLLLLEPFPRESFFAARSIRRIEKQWINTMIGSGVLPAATREKLTGAQKKAAIEIRDAVKRIHHVIVQKIPVHHYTTGKELKSGRNLIYP